MTGNSVFRHQRSGVLSIASVEAPNIITSDWIDEQLADTYKRNGLRAGLLDGLAGETTTRIWARKEKRITTRVNRGALY